MIKLDVIRRRGSGNKANRLPHDESDGLCFCFPYCLGGCCASFGLVKHLVGCFVYQRGELLGLGLARKDGNASAIAHPRGGENPSL